jgi:hypothetical protein
MDPLVLNLQKASTSSDLVSAVDALAQNEKYFTSQVRDLLIAKNYLIVDAATADSVVKFLLPFSGVESLRPLLRKQEVHDLIINNIAPQVTAIYEFGRSICRIAYEQVTPDLYSNVETFTVILKSFHRSKTSKDAHWIATSINNIVNNNPSSNILLNSLPVVQAFSFIIPLANDADAVQWISNALKQILNNNEEAQKNFETPEFFKIFKGMEKYATTQDSKTSFQSVVDVIKSIAENRETMQKSLVNSTSTQQLTTALQSITSQRDRYLPLVDLLLQKQRLIQDQTSAIAAANFIKWFGLVDLKSIAKKEIFELIDNVLIPKFYTDSTTMYLISSIFDALAGLFKEESARNYFVKTSFRDFVFLSLSSSPGNSVVESLYLLLSNNITAREIFGTPEFRKQFSSKAPSSDSSSRIVSILDDAITNVRLKSLKKLAEEHNSNIDNDLLKNLAKQGVDASKFHVLDSVMLEKASFSFTDIIDINLLLELVRAKRNLVSPSPPLPPFSSSPLAPSPSSSPSNQDPNLRGELERLRQQHNDLRKLYQEYVDLSNRTIVDLMKDRDETNKKLDDTKKSLLSLERSINGNKTITRFVYNDVQDQQQNARSVPLMLAALVILVLCLFFVFYKVKEFFFQSNKDEQQHQRVITIQHSEPVELTSLEEDDQTPIS